MNVRLRWVAHLVLLLGAVATSCNVAQADTYPSRPIRLIVPTAAGGGTDILARLVGQEMSKSLGQTVVVDNRPGAGSTIGTEIASRATPDGYTLLIVTPSFAINPEIRAHLPYNSLQAFDPISEIASVENLLLVTSALPANNIQQLASLLRAHPGKYNYASGGYGTPPFMAMELFKAMGGFNIVHIAYKGSGPALAALMANQVSVMINGAPPALPLLKAGKIRALAVTSLHRWKRMPSLPTISETIEPGYQAVTWFGLLAPHGTPSPIIAKVGAAVSAALRNPTVTAKLTSAGFQVVGSNAQAFRKLLVQAMQTYARVIGTQHLKIIQ